MTAVSRKLSTRPSNASVAGRLVTAANRWADTRAAARPFGRVLATGDARPPHNAAAARRWRGGPCLQALGQQDGPFLARAAIDRAADSHRVGQTGPLQRPEGRQQSRIAGLGGGVELEPDDRRRLESPDEMRYRRGSRRTARQRALRRAWCGRGPRPEPAAPRARPGRRRSKACPGQRLPSRAPRVPSRLRA